MKWRRGHREEGSTCTLHLLRTSIWWCLKVLIGNIFSPFCLLLNLSQVYLTASLMSPGYGSHTVRSSYISPLFALHSFPRDFLQLSSRVTSCPPHSCPHLHWGPLSLLFCVSSKCDRFQSCLVSPCSFPVVSFLPFNIHHFLFAPPTPQPLLSSTSAHLILCSLCISPPISLPQSPPSPPPLTILVPGLIKQCSQLPCVIHRELSAEVTEGVKLKVCKMVKFEKLLEFSCTEREQTKVWLYVKVTLTRWDNKKVNCSHWQRQQRDICCCTNEEVVFYSSTVNCVDCKTISTDHSYGHKKLVSKQILTLRRASVFQTDL